MKRILPALLLISALGAGCVFSPTARQPISPTPVAGSPEDMLQHVPTMASGTASETSPTNPPSQQPVREAEMMPPLSRATERITKKMFGTKVSPGNSPVSPEKFTGYHTGTDFEIFDDEKDVDVQVNVICAGKLLRAGTASGYGGYAVQACKIDGQDVTVVYGHLRAASIKAHVGDLLKSGQALAVLGKGYSTETDGERKHLHLDIHRGTAVNIRGYVSSASSLKDWIDYQTLTTK